MGRSLRRSESRVKAKGGPVERFAVQELLVFWERYGIAQDECYYCGVWLMGMAPDQATLEHLQPVSRGGAHAMYNIVPCCERCNLAASRMDLTHAA
jgi:5-methylcytosine-specific restriction endonuclease McrA